jgi:hypothetical protein
MQNVIILYINTFVWFLPALLPPRTKVDNRKYCVTKPQTAQIENPRLPNIDTIHMDSENGMCSSIDECRRAADGNGTVSKAEKDTKKRAENGPKEGPVGEIVDYIQHLILYPQKCADMIAVGENLGDVGPAKHFLGIPRLHLD